MYQLLCKNASNMWYPLDAFNVSCFSFVHFCGILDRYVNEDLLFWNDEFAYQLFIPGESSFYCSIVAVGVQQNCIWHFSNDIVANLHCYYSSTITFPQGEISFISHWNKNPHDCYRSIGN